MKDVLHEVTARTVRGDRHALATRDGGWIDEVPAWPLG